MTKISQYTEASPPGLEDLLIGTDINGTGESTKNFLIGDINTLFKGLASLQDVVNVGNTITVPISKSKGIDITLANLGTVYQNGVLVTIPNQTGSNASPDAYVAKINGQSPGTLNGFTGGFAVDAHGLDNIGFYADLQTDSGTSAGCVMKSFDSHAGDLFRGTKRIGSVESTVFKVEHNGDTTAKSLFLYDNQGEGYSQIGVEDYLFYVTYPSSNLRLLEVSGNALALANSSGGTAVILNNLTTTRSYALPNASGTFALTSDIVVPNLQLVTDFGDTTSNDITANSFIKTGGTAGQYLMADGSSLSNISTNSTTTALSLATLNSTYPTAIIGFRVHCPSIIAGKLIYEKAASGWLSYSVNLVA